MTSAGPTATTLEEANAADSRRTLNATLLEDVLAAHATLAQAHDQHRHAALAFWQARANFEKALGAGQ